MNWLQSLIELLVFALSNKNDAMPPEQPAQPLNPPTHPDLLAAFCTEIQNMEGWYDGSPSFVRNNPGNLRCPPLNVLASKCAGGFCFFEDHTTGFQALLNVTKSCAKGLSTTYNTAAKHFGLTSGADLNLYQYFLIRDPASDGNDPSALGDRFGKALGVNPSTLTMKQLL